MYLIIGKRYTYVNMYIFRDLTQLKYGEKKYCYMIESLVCP